MKKEVVNLDTIARVMIEKAILEPGSTIYLETYKQLKEHSYEVTHQAVSMPMPPASDWRDQSIGNLVPHSNGNVVEKSDENTVA